MNIISIILLWFSFPLLVSIFAYARLRRLRKERLHDLILYRFCDVRDAIALKAARNELSEDSEIFKFFYAANAGLIHNHKRVGLCFDNFARHILGGELKAMPDRHRPMPAHTKRLFRQLKHADEETKQIATAWIYGCAAMLDEAARGMRVERLIWKTLRRGSDFYRWLGRQFYVPALQRQTATFISGLARAVNAPVDADPEMAIA